MGVGVLLRLRLRVLKDLGLSNGGGKCARTRGLGEFVRSGGGVRGREIWFSCGQAKGR